MDNESNEVQVSSVTVGEMIPLRGVWFQVEASDGHTVTLKVVSVTAGFLKKQSSAWRKQNGKHWRRKARADFAHAVNQERKRMAAEVRSWLRAEMAYKAGFPGEDGVLDPVAESELIDSELATPSTDAVVKAYAEAGLIGHEDIALD